MCPSKGASEQKTRRLEFCLNLIVDINEHLQNASFLSFTVRARVCVRVPLIYPNILLHRNTCTEKTTPEVC